jgi:hypothetical protein
MWKNVKYTRIWGHCKVYLKKKRKREEKEKASNLHNILRTFHIKCLKIQ